MMLDWPADIHPTTVAFWFEPVTAISISGLTRQMLAAEREGERWVAEVTVDLSGAQAARFGAWLAACRGPVASFRVPLWLHEGPTGSLQSMDDYAAAIGVTRFTDGIDFDDGIGFIEGAGQPHITGGVAARLAVAGFARWTDGVLKDGDAVTVPPGSVHLLVQAGRTDIDGRMIVAIRPGIRTPIGRAPVVTDGLVLRMRLADDDIGRGVTRPPARTRWTVSLVEDLS
jgi:hypothetical protein